MGLGRLPRQFCCFSGYLSFGEGLQPSPARLRFQQVDKEGFVRALVVDDSRAMRAILGRILRELGYQVLEAGNGREGLECLRKLGPAELALVDWNMPEMNGLDFLRAVRKERTYDAMYVMMVSTETEMEEVTEALGVGASEYVMKPFTKEVILEKLQILGLVRC